MNRGGKYDKYAGRKMVRARTKIESLAPNEGCCGGQNAPQKEVSKLSDPTSTIEWLHTKNWDFLRCKMVSMRTLNRIFVYKNARDWSIIDSFPQLRETL
jgi:hypothetical protein